MNELRKILQHLAGAATLAAPALPQLGQAIARILAAALGASAALIDAGAKSVEEVVASIRRVGRIDTSSEDAELDARIAALPRSAALTRSTAPTLEALLASHVGRQTLSVSERDAIGAALRLVRDHERSALPPVLETPESSEG